MMMHLRLLGGAVLLGIHLIAWPADHPFRSAEASTKAERAMVVAARDVAPRWDQLSLEERESLRARRQQYEALLPSERQKIREVHQKYQELSSDERRALQERWRSQRKSDNESRGPRSRGRD